MTENRSVGVEGQERGITKENEETFGYDGCVHYVDCGDGFMDVWNMPTHQFMYFKLSIQFYI